MPFVHKMALKTTKKKEERFMKLNLFAICEGAFNHNGHLTIVNTKDFINTEKFPYRADQLGLALRLEFDASETGEHPFELGYVDPVGTYTTMGKSSIKVEQAKQNTLFCLAANLSGFIFTHPGIYKFVVKVDENEVGCEEFMIKRPEAENDGKQE